MGLCTRTFSSTNIRDAQANPAAGNWACQLSLRAQSLGMSAPFDASGSVVIDAAQHRDQALRRVQRDWDDTFLPDPVPALVPSCARIIAGFRVPILRLQNRTLSCH